MDDFSNLVRSSSREAVESFDNFVLNVCYKGIDKYGYGIQIDESIREESF